MLIKKDGKPVTDLYLNYYTSRIIFKWNALPVDIRAITLTEEGKNTTFKNCIKLYYYEMLNDRFNENDLCTWTNKCRCVRCRLI